MCIIHQGVVLLYLKWIIPQNGNSPKVTPEVNPKVNLLISPKWLPSYFTQIMDRPPYEAILLYSVKNKFVNSTLLPLALPAKW